MQLLGEEVNSQVAVLTSLSGGGDADDLARTTLQDQEIANADVVAGDGDGVGSGHGSAGAVRGTLTWGRHGDFAVTDDNVFVTLVAVFVFVVVVTSAFEWVEDTISGLVETVAERVVVAVLVVVSHVLFGWGVDGSAVYLNRFFETNGVTFGEAVCWVVTRVRGLVLPITRRAVLFDEWGGAVTEVSLGNVDARVDVDVGGWSVTSGILAVVVTVLDVDLSVGVPLIWFTVSLTFNINLYTLVAVRRSLLAALNMDIDVLTVAVVSTGSLRSVSLLSIVFPSSAFNGDLCVFGDFGVGGLLVPVG